MKRWQIRLKYALAATALLLVLPVNARAILQKGEVAPQFKATNLANQQISLAAYRGKVVVLDFFATWCGPCKESLPHMVELHRKYSGKGLQILGVSADDESDRLYVKVFVSDLNLPYPVFIANEDLQADYGLRSVPMIVVINKKGIVAEKYMGYSSTIAKKMEDLIKRLMAE
jgi:thiol-disulfide isomerase/thioredoxin